METRVAIARSSDAERYFLVIMQKRNDDQFQCRSYEVSNYVYFHDGVVYLTFKSHIDNMAILEGV